MLDSIAFWTWITSSTFKSEIGIIDQHYKEILEKIMRLHPRTPRCLVYFLAGSLPGTALLHQKMLGIFGMICRLKDDILHRHAIHVLTVSKPSCKSWFVEIRNLCLQYGLPHPLLLLQSSHSIIFRPILFGQQQVLPLIMSRWAPFRQSWYQGGIGLNYFAATGLPIRVASARHPLAWIGKFQRTLNISCPYAAPYRKLGQCFSNSHPNTAAQFQNWGTSPAFCRPQLTHHSVNSYLTVQCCPRSSLQASS